MNVQETYQHDPEESQEEKAGTVYLVDDHQVELDLMQKWCERAGFETRSFADPQKLLANLQPSALGCVVADLRMPHISGLELQAEMSRRDLTIPVILVTGHGDAENCRTAFRQGVFDFIEKGFDSNQLIESITRAVRTSRRDQFRNQIRREANVALSRVSPRENEVVQLLASGMPLKGIAQELKISVQTASKHRSSIFTKLHIDNEVDLYKMLLAAGVDMDAPATETPSA